jgi:hypothetical protein
MWPEEVPEMDTERRGDDARMTPHRHHRLLALVVALLLGLFAVFAFAATETGEMKLEEGFVDPQSGVKVDRVVTDPATGMQEVTLAVPRGVAPEPIDEIVVTARRPDRVTLPQLKPHRFVADYDNDYYGLVIFLGKRENLPLRLYLDSRQGAPGTVSP